MPSWVVPSDSHAPGDTGHTTDHNSIADDLTLVNNVIPVVSGGLTGATAAIRFVGATTSGSPGSGTFAKGDVAGDQTGKLWMCTTAGSPGSWTQIAAVTGTLSQYIAPAVVALTGAASTLVNAALGNDFRLTLTSSAWTIANPTNSVDGQRIDYQLAQDGTGSRTVAWDTNYDFGAAGTPTLTTTASKVDIIGFIFNAALSKWCFTGIVKAFLGVLVFIGFRADSPWGRLAEPVLGSASGAPLLACLEMGPSDNRVHDVLAPRAVAKVRKLIAQLAARAMADIQPRRSRPDEGFGHEAVHAHLGLRAVAGHSDEQVSLAIRMQGENLAAAPSADGLPWQASHAAKVADLIEAFPSEYGKPSLTWQVWLGDPGALRESQGIACPAPVAPVVRTPAASVVRLAAAFNAARTIAHVDSLQSAMPPERSRRSRGSFRASILVPGLP